jgi:hypothetical protein
MYLDFIEGDGLRAVTANSSGRWLRLPIQEPPLVASIRSSVGCTAM